MKVRIFVKSPTLVNIISFIITFILFTPFNIFVKEFLNIRFYPSYIMLFLMIILITFLIFTLYVFNPYNLKKLIVFGICSGYIVSIVAYQGMSMIVINNFFIPTRTRELFLLFVRLPFLLFGWLYGLLMGATLYFLTKKINTLGKKNHLK